MISDHVYDSQTKYVEPGAEQYTALLDELRSAMKEGHGETFVTVGTGGVWKKDTAVMYHQTFTNTLDFALVMLI